MNLPLALRILLWPLSLVYGGCVSLRAWLYAKGCLEQKRLRGKVISVGNLIVGGTGKTPMVLWLAERFLAEGKRVAILSRGYHGSGGTSDEVEMMKKRLGGRVDFGVGKDRFTEGRRIEERAPVDVFLLDDGFQHFRLCRDLDVLMLDGSRKLKNEWLLPSGSLREPIAGCSRADLLIVTRKNERPEIEASDSHKFSIFYAQTRLLGFRYLGRGDQLKHVSEIGAGPFFAFCGIGNPEAFFEDLSHWHVPVAGKQAFRDHHKYSASDLQGLTDQAQSAGAIAFVTTEKDACNIEERGQTPLPIFVAVIDFVLSSESEFLAAMDRKLNLARGAVA